MENSGAMTEAKDVAKVLVTDNGFRAFLLLHSVEECSSISENEVAVLLNGAGVVFGVKTELLGGPIRNVTTEGKILIAEGVRPIAGKNGWVEYAGRTEPPAQAEATESKVDFHSLGWIHNVVKGDTVAIVHLPEQGVAGRTVTGKIVPAAAGKEQPLKLRKFVERDQDNPCRIIATHDGNLQVRPGHEIEIEPVITVRGDIDYSTGDIDFVGGVIVTGDVKGGFSVRAKTSVEIWGNVEDATVESDGDVKIQKGFVGQGKGAVVAGGSVTVQRVLNQTVTSGKDITVQREAVCAKLRANEKIFSPEASFAGCLLEAGSEIEVLNLGIGDHGQAKARVGKRALVLERINNNEKESLRIQKQVDDIKEGIYRFIRLELDGGANVIEQREKRSKLQALQGQLQKTLDDLRKERESLKLELGETKSAKIIVRDTLFSNVFVELNGIKKLVQCSLKEVILIENGGKIEERSLEVG